MVKKAKKVAAEVGGEKSKNKYTLEQLLGSRSFIRCADALKTVLKPDKRYTVEEAQAALDRFYERKV